MERNFVPSFPADLDLQKCSNLRELYMSHFEYDINSFDDEHLSLPNLRTLQISQRLTSTNPVLTFNALQLTNLDISSNSIKTIDAEIAHAFP